MGLSIFEEWSIKQFFHTSKIDIFIFVTETLFLYKNIFSFVIKIFFLQSMQMKVSSYAGG